MDLNELTQLGLLPGRFLLQIDTQNAQDARIQARGSDVESIPHIQGELRFWIGEPQGTDKNGRIKSPVDLPRIGIMSSGVEAEPDQYSQLSATGRISIYNSVESDGFATESDEGLQLKLEATVELLYERLQYQQLRAEAEGRLNAEDQRGAPMTFKMDGHLTLVEQPQANGQFAHFTGKLSFEQLSHEANEIQSNVIERIDININMEGETVYHVGATSLRSEERLEKKTIVVQPIIFADKPMGTDANTDAEIEETMKYFRAQLKRANQLWNPGCIEFEVAKEDPEVIENSDLKVSNDIMAIAASARLDINGQKISNAAQEEPKSIIEIFLVRNRLTHVMGGDTRQGGTGLDKVVISDGRVGHKNPQLLAHELGHVIKLLHPNATPSVFTPGTQGSTGSIMQPITKLKQNHPRINTKENCLAADSPAKKQRPPAVCSITEDSWKV